MAKLDERQKRILNDTQHIMFDQLEQLNSEIRSNKDINVTDLDAIYKIADVVKDIRTTCAMDEAGSYEDYSYYMDYEENPEKLAHARMSYYDRTKIPYHDPTYTDGMIMHNRGGYNRSMRHSDNPNMRNSDDQDYSRTRTMQHLERMLDQAATDEERKVIVKCMNKV